MDLAEMFQQDFNKKIQAVADDFIQTNVEKYVSQDDFTYAVNNIVEERIDKLINSSEGNEGLENFIIEAIKPGIYQWFNNNIGQDDMKLCLRQAFKHVLVEKLREFSLEDLCKVSKYLE